MAFKSEIHVAELASIRTGHTEGDIYYILDNGMLGELPCKPGAFVKWHNDAWQIQPDEHYALASVVDGEIAQAIDNVLDDRSESETIVVAVPSSQAGNYTVGDYYEVQGKVARLRTKTEGDNVTQLTFDTTSGVLEAINNVTVGLVKNRAIGTEWVPGPVMAGAVYMHDGLRYVCIANNMDEEWDPSHWTLLSVGVDIERLQKAVGSIKNGGALTDAASINVPNNTLSTLATAQATLTLNVNVSADDVPNFAVEVTPSVDCTLTVTKTIAPGGLPTELTPSVAGGNSLTTGKKYQVTCVGSCWTLAEFTVPTP